MKIKFLFLVMIELITFVIIQADPAIDGKSNLKNDQSEKISKEALKLQAQFKSELVKYPIVPIKNIVVKEYKENCLFLIEEKTEIIGTQIFETISNDSVLNLKLQKKILNNNETLLERGQYKLFDSTLDIKSPFIVKIYFNNNRLYCQMINLESSQYLINEDFPFTREVLDSKFLQDYLCAKIRFQLKIANYKTRKSLIRVRLINCPIPIVNSGQAKSIDSQKFNKVKRKINDDSRFQVINDESAKDVNLNIFILLSINNNLSVFTFGSQDNHNKIFEFEGAEDLQLIEIQRKICDIYEYEVLGDEIIKIQGLELMQLGEFYFGLGLYDESYKNITLAYNNNKDNDYICSKYFKLIFSNKDNRYAFTDEQIYIGEKNRILKMNDNFQLLVSDYEANFRSFFLCKHFSRLSVNENLKKEMTDVQGQFIKKCLRSYGLLETLKLDILYNYADDDELLKLLILTYELAAADKLVKLENAELEKAAEMLFAKFLKDYSGRKVKLIVPLKEHQDPILRNYAISIIESPAYKNDINRFNNQEKEKEKEEERRKERNAKLMKEKE